MEYDIVTRIAGYYYLKTKECAYQPIQFIKYLQPVSLQLPAGSHHKPTHEIQLRRFTTEPTAGF